MTMYGADPDALVNAAAELFGAADELDSSAKQLASSLNSLSWLGQVAIRFLDVWNTRHSREMQVTAAFLRDNGRRLHDQASQQRNASAGGGGQSGWSAGWMGQGSGGLTPPSGGPDVVAEWWTSLDPSQQDELINGNPSLVGNLDGVPFAIRVEANQLYMQQLLDGEADPSGPMHQLIGQFVDPATGKIDPNRKILVFDPSGDGKVAEVFGDITTASHLAIIVPGMGSTAYNFSGVSEDAKKLQETAGAGTAVIAWTGYDAPAGTEQGVKAIEVASDAQAKAGGLLLQQFVSATKQEYSGDITIVGHSYGSLVVGQSLLAGTTVNNVVFIGSPGVGVNNVEGFPPGAADRYFAGEVDGDPVAQLERFGDAPTDPDFGATVFDAGNGNSLNPLGRHSEYFDDGDAIGNLATIIQGSEPSGGSTAPIEMVMEINEDVRDVGNAAVDRAQQIVDVPFVDDQIDAVIDGGQAVGDGVYRVGSIVAEEVGHYAQDGAEWVGDAVVDGAQAVGGAVVDGAGWVGDRADDVGDAISFWN